MADALIAALETNRLRRQLPPPSACRQLRERVGLTQLDVAVAVKVTRAAVALWEAGRRQPRDHHLARYLAVLERLAREAV